MIIIHPARRMTLMTAAEAVGRNLVQLKDHHYPGYRDQGSPHHGVRDGQMHKVPVAYHAGRRTLNHVIARAAREGRIFTRDPSECRRLPPRRRSVQRVAAGNRGKAQAIRPGS